MYPHVFDVLIVRVLGVKPKAVVCLLRLVGLALHLHTHTYEYLIQWMAARLTMNSVTPLNTQVRVPYPMDDN
jgi:hypothetical protein